MSHEIQLGFKDIGEAKMYIKDYPKTHQMHVQISQEFYRELAKAAEDLGISYSEFVRRACTKYLTAYELVKRYGESA